MIDITTLGEILIDFTPVKTNNGKHTYEQNAGGAPANLLAAAAHYGGTCAFLGKVGTDAFGKFLEKTLKDCKIDTRGLRFDPVHNTTLAFVSLDESGDRSFSFYRNFGADVFLEPNEIAEDVIRSSRIFHFGSLSLTADPVRSATDKALKIAKESGCLITMDPNYRPLLWKDEKTAVKTIRAYLPMADIAKLSMEELILVTGKSDVQAAMEEVLGWGVRLVLVTDGPNGVTFATPRAHGFVPSMKVEVVDTTGAGDIFFGTFLYAITRDAPDLQVITAEQISKAVAIAVRASGLSTTKKGAIASIPSYEEVF